MLKKLENRNLELGASRTSSTPREKEFDRRFPAISDFQFLDFYFLDFFPHASELSLLSIIEGGVFPQ